MGYVSRNKNVPVLAEGPANHVDVLENSDGDGLFRVLGFGITIPLASGGTKSGPVALLLEAASVAGLANNDDTV